MGSSPLFVAVGVVLVVIGALVAARLTRLHARLGLAGVGLDPGAGLKRHGAKMIEAVCLLAGDRLNTEPPFSRETWGEIGLLRTAWQLRRADAEPGVAHAALELEAEAIVQDRRVVRRLAMLAGAVFPFVAVGALSGRLVESAAAVGWRVDVTGAAGAAAVLGLAAGYLTLYTWFAILTTGASRRHDVQTFVDADILGRGLELIREGVGAEAIRERLSVYLAQPCATAPEVGVDRLAA